MSDIYKDKSPIRLFIEKSVAEIKEKNPTLKLDIWISCSDAMTRLGINDVSELQDLAENNLIKRSQAGSHVLYDSRSITAYIQSNLH